LLVDREATYRRNNKVARLLKMAKLKLQAHPEDIDYRHPAVCKKASSLICSAATGSTNIIMY
jgi:hypothetical protein